jgi:hypothetical protein
MSTLMVLPTPLVIPLRAANSIQATPAALGN